MTSFSTLSNALKTGAGALLLAALAACGGGKDPILGGPDIGQLPTVTATSPMASTPIAAAIDVNAAVSATFSKPMQAASITASSFTLVCPTGAPVAATVTYDAPTQVATLTPNSALPPSTTCVATVGAGVLDTSGLALGTDYTWSFVTSTPPTVTFVTPAAGADGIANNTQVSATFSRPMQAASITASSFTLSCPAGTPVAASVTYDAPTQVATLTPNSALPLSTTCVATIDSGVLDTDGLALGTAFAWSFVTGGAVVADSTRPTVVFAAPGAAASDVANNAQISATFSEAMQASTLTASSFTLMNTTLGTAVTGTVSYAAASRTAVFTPVSPATLPANTLITATITSAATDLAGNALAGNTAVLPGAGNHVWTFTTGAAADTTAPTVLSVSPDSGSADVCLTRSVNATFSEPMNATTINNTTLRVTDGGTPVPGIVSYDAPSRIATFVPGNSAGFAASRTFVVTIASGDGGVKDLAGNALSTDRTWTFATGTQPCATGPVIVPAANLGTAASFGAFGGAAGVTSQGVQTQIGGNVGTTAACTLITGLHDATNVYTETPLNIGGVNGSIYCAPPAPGTAVTLAVANQALADAQAAYNTLAAMPPGSDPGAGELGGLVLAGGVYTAAGGTFAVTSGDLTLDAKGDAGTVWVFQSAASLTVGLPATPRSVQLINGAQAGNVFWQVGSAARIEAGSAMVGTIIAPAGVTISTAGQTTQTVLTGRALGLTASVTMVNTTIVAP